MWRMRLVKNFFIVILLGGSIIFPPSVQVMSNHIYEQGTHPELTEYELFKTDGLLDSMAIPEVFVENEELQEDAPLWLEEIEEEEELIELPLPEQTQEEQKQEEERQQQENETRLDEETMESESGLTKEKILEEVQDEGIARVLIHGARTLFSGQLGSIPWVVDAQGKLILGSGVFDEANNIGERYAATDYFNHPMYSQAITSVQLTGPIALRGLNGSLNISGDIRRGFFADLRNVREIEGIEFLDTSGSREMSFMFANMSALTSLDVSGFDTSNVTNMQEMFQNMSSLTELDVSGFDTHNVWSMQGMFQNMSSLTELDVSSFDTTNLSSMTRMFEGATSLTKLDVSGLNTSNLRSLNQTFRNVSSLTELDISHFDTSQVVNMSGTFEGATSLTKLNISNIDTSNVTDMFGMFTDVRSLTELDISHFDTSQVENMAGMFNRATSLTKLDISGFDTSNVRNMVFMFNEVNSLTELDVSGFNTSKVTNMRVMFRNMSSLTELDVSGFDTSNVTDMSFMFHNVRNVTKLDVSGFDTSNVTDMHVMFEGVSSVTELDVSSFDTSNVINLSFMFHTVSSVTELDVSGFDTSNVTTMAFMFHNMGNVTELDVSGFDTSNVMDISFMFNEVSNVTELDVSGFDTSNVTTMAFMFHNVSNVTELDVSGFDTGNVTNMWRMFMGTSSLTKLDLSRFDTRNVTNMQGMFERIPLEQLILGSDFVFHSANGSPGLLPLSGSATHHPNWQNVGAGTVDEPKGNFVFTSAQLMANYDGSTMADTWVWQPRIFVNLTIEIEGQGTVTPNTTTSIERGGMIDISATPELGWRFSHWRIESGEGTITDIDQSTTTFAIGDEDTKLVAVFEDLGELLSVRIPTSAVFNTTSKSGHRDIVAPDYAIGNESPFAVSVNVVAPTELKNMNIIEELNVVGDGKENLLIRKGNSHQTEPFRLFDLAVEEANTFTFTGIAEKLSEESSHITPTFNMVLRFIPNL